jgi:hypothetical protein
MAPRKSYQNFNIIFFPKKGNFQHKTMYQKLRFRGLNETAKRLLALISFNQNPHCFTAIAKLTASG